STLACLDFIRVPSPAARISKLTGDLISLPERVICASPPGRAAPDPWRSQPWLSDRAGHFRLLPGDPPLPPANPWRPAGPHRSSPVALSRQHISGVGGH